MRKFLLSADRIYAIPGWLVMRALLKGFKTHPWKERNFSLSDWTKYRTNDMRAFDMCFWVSIIAAPLVIYFYFSK
ncbi:MAG: hypothetical protein ABWX90_03315 [Candidatus Saccharimonadales bacterium]